MKSLSTLGTLGVACLVSLSAHAGAVADLKPIEIKPIETIDASTGKAKLAPVDASGKVAPQKGGLNFGAMNSPTTAPQGPSCDSAGEAGPLAAGTKVSFASVKAALDAGILVTDVTTADCKLPAATMGVEARENLDETAECALNQGVNRNTSEAQRVDVEAGCLATALNKDGGADAVTKEDAQARIAALRGEHCHYLN